MFAIRWPSEPAHLYRYYPGEKSGLSLETEGYIYLHLACIHLPARPGAELASIANAWV